MSFGYGVGDTIMAAQLARKIYRRFITAPEEFKAVRDEVHGLWVVLEDIGDSQSELGLSNDQQRKLKELTDNCNNVLADLHKILDKYHSLDTDPAKWADKSRKVWKRIRWEPEDIRDLRSRIASNASILNSFHANLMNKSSRATKDGVDRLNKAEDSQQRRTIVNWLSPTDYGVHQSDFINKRQKGTGQWLLESEIYRKWCSGTEQTLFCPGIPGAGKTIITSIVVDNLRKNFQAHSDIGIAYLYCIYNEQQAQKGVKLLRGLLRQLVQEHSVLPTDVQDLYERHFHHGTSPSIDEVSHALNSMIRTYSKVYFLVDALDECSKVDGTQEQLLAEIFKLQSQNPTKVSLFATSRFIPEIIKKFEGSAWLEIRAHEEDIRTYLEHQIPRLPSCVLKKPDLQTEIKTRIISAVDGMFLLAQLHLDSLTDKTKPKAIRIALEKLPKGSEGLETAYAETVKRIESQKEGLKDLAKEVISWIIHAKRRMTVTELQHALAIEESTIEFDEENLPEPEEMVSVCAGLVTVDETSNIIRLAHYTTEEYFQRKGEFWVPDSQTNITMACLTYLSYDALSCPMLTKEAFNDILQEYVFFSYASNYWGYHAHGIEEQIESAAIPFLLDKSKVAYSIKAKRNMNSNGTTMHLIAAFGLNKLLLTLLKLGYDLNATNEDKETPLFEAIDQMHEATVELLLEQGAEADLQNHHGWSPLHFTAQAGQMKIAKMLLEHGAQVSAKDVHNATPIFYAALSGQEAMVKFLLEQGAEADLEADDAATPLAYAASKGHESLVKFFISLGIKDHQEEQPDTALWNAISYEHEGVVKLLLEHEPELVTEDEDCWVWLHCAVRCGSEVMLKFLFEQDRFDITARNPNNTTRLLSTAIEYGREGVVKLLLERSEIEIEIDQKLDDGHTLLSLAAKEGHKGIVKLLEAEMANCKKPEPAGKASLSKTVPTKRSEETSLCYA
ncbi:MAG: hypothetical protein M1834_004531 [Cirrosporium novae-zelandiae]|nr:MAG: hypothetical protein M1834_004531 [Cirrosporium novae-zelandiae]